LWPLLAFFLPTEPSEMAQVLYKRPERKWTSIVRHLFFSHQDSMIIWSFWFFFLGAIFQFVLWSFDLRRTGFYLCSQIVACILFFKFFWSGDDVHSTPFVNRMFFFMLLKDGSTVRCKRMVHGILTIFLYPK